jgi:hypothetical protein
VVAAENEAVEWMSFIAGPSLDILRNELTNATAEVYIPYAPTMGEYVTAEEASLMLPHFHTREKISTTCRICHPAH